MNLLSLEARQQNYWKNYSLRTLTQKKKFIIQAVLKGHGEYTMNVKLAVPPREILQLPRQNKTALGPGIG
jgi:hypothetical protein